MKLSIASGAFGAVLGLAAAGPCFAQSEAPRIPELRDTVGLMEQAQAGAARASATKQIFHDDVDVTAKVVRDRQMSSEADRIVKAAAAEGRATTKEERERIALLRAGSVERRSPQGDYLAQTGVQYPRRAAFFK